MTSTLPPEHRVREPPPVPRPVTPVGLAAQALAAAVGADLPGDVAEQVGRASELVGGLDPYLAACTTPESPALSALARATAEHDWSARPDTAVFLEQEMLSGHVEGQLLKTLVRLARARRVLEIGMFTGYPALAMAEALPEGGVVVALELDAEVAAFARACFDDSPAGRKIAVRVGPALASFAELAGEVFDLVFVDADKPGYLAYLQALLDGGMVAPHGLVCVDNTLLQGEPWTGTPTVNGQAIAEFNRAVAADPRVEQVLLPLRDGLLLVQQVPDQHGQRQP